MQELMHKEIKTLPEKIKEIKNVSVSAKDIQKVAKIIFQDKKLNLAIVGPIKNKKDISRILTF